MKCLLMFVITATIAVNGYPITECGSSPSHNLFLGERQSYDRLVYSKRETYGPSTSQMSKYLILIIFEKETNETITRIEVRDNFTEGDGGCPFLIEGGVGDKLVKLNVKTLETQKEKKYDFQVDVYGG